jgi:hypothetical protein
LSILSTTYKIIPNILLSRLTPYGEEITGERQCGFRSYRSNTDYKLCISQILEKNGNALKQSITFFSDEYFMQEVAEECH